MAPPYRRKIMKKIVITYGLISGVVAGGFLLTTVLLWENGYLLFDMYDYGMLLGYASMLVAFSMVFFGVKAYRDNQEGGTITFWKALQIGLLISIIGSIIYAASWEVYMQSYPGFMERYVAGYLDKMRAGGTPQAEIDAAAQSMASIQELYRNPVYRFGFSLMEIVPVGVIVSLLSAAVLRRKTERLVEQPA
jgi:hypothetical protein